MPRTLQDELHATEMVSEPCFHVARDNKNRIRAMAPAHVDDIVVAGKVGHPICEAFVKGLRGSYRFGSLEKGGAFLPLCLMH